MDLPMGKVLTWEESKDDSAVPDFTEPTSIKEKIKQDIKKCNTQEDRRMNHALRILRLERVYSFFESGNQGSFHRGDGL